MRRNVSLLRWSLWTLLTLTLVSRTVPAQTPGSGLTESELLALHEAGVGAAELVSILEKEGFVGLDRTILDTLRTKGIPAEVITSLEGILRKSGPVHLTVDDIVLLTTGGATETEIIARITETGSTFDLSKDDVLNLVRKKVHPSVIRLMRESSSAGKAVESVATTVTLEDVEAMAAAQVPAEEMLRRLKKSKASFIVTTDDLIRLTRAQVPKEVLKEIWNRRTEEASSKVTPAEDLNEEPKPAPTGPLALKIHRETAGGFTLTIPENWFLHRENVGANTLLSFTEREPTLEAALPDAEIQVFRYRSPTPERLTESNLEPIATNFLGRLQASYASKQMTLSFSKTQAMMLSGRPCLVSKVASTSKDDVAHEGEVMVTLQGDQVFVLSYASRAERAQELAPTLRSCARSFTLEIDQPLPPSNSEKAEDVLAGLFEAWRNSIKNRDFALYRKVCGDAVDTAKGRAHFVSAAEKFSGSDLRLSLGKIELHPTGAKVECLVLSPFTNETLTLAFERSGKSYLLHPE